MKTTMYCKALTHLTKAPLLQIRSQSFSSLNYCASSFLNSTKLPNTSQNVYPFHRTNLTSSLIFSQKSLRSLQYNPRQQFSFFSKIFLSKEQKRLLEIRTNFYLESGEQQIKYLEELIKIPSPSSSQQYLSFQFKIALYEQFHKNKQYDSSNIIWDQLLAESQLSQRLEIFSRRLLLDPSNEQHYNDLVSLYDVIMKMPSTGMEYELTLCHLSLALWNKIQKQMEKCENHFLEGIKICEGYLSANQSSTKEIKYKQTLLARAQICLAFSQEHFNDEQFKESNILLEALDSSWDFILKEYDFICGYPINTLIPSRKEQLLLQIKLDEFNQEYNSAIEQYLQLIKPFEEYGITKLNENSKKEFVKLKLNFINAMVFNQEYQDLEGELKKLISVADKSDVTVQARICEQEANIAVGNSSRNCLNTVERGLLYCNENKLRNSSYFRLLFLKWSLLIQSQPKSSSQEAKSLIEELWTLAEEVNDIHPNIQIEFFLAGSNYLALQNEQQTLLKLQSQSINMIKKYQSPFQVLSIYCQHIFENIHCKNILDSERLRKDAQVYFDSITLERKTQELTIKLKLLECDELISAIKIKEQKEREVKK